MLFLLQPVFRCPEKGLLGDVYSPPDNDRSHDVQVSQVQEKNDVQSPKIEEKITKTLIFQLDDPLPPDRNVGPNRPRLRRPPARVGQDVPVHALSQISLSFIFFMLVHELHSVHSICTKYVYDRYTRYQKTCDAVFVLFAITWVVTRLGFSA